MPLDSQINRVQMALNNVIFMFSEDVILVIFMFSGRSHPVDPDHKHLQMISLWWLDDVLNSIVVHAMPYKILHLIWMAIFWFETAFFFIEQILIK